MTFAAALAAADSAARQHLGGAVIRYAPSIGAPVDVTGLFEAVYVRVDAGTPGVSTSGPAVWLHLADLPIDPDLDAGAIVTVNGTPYTVREAKKDGMGSVLLFLNEA
jgi:hypothetical protein